MNAFFKYLQIIPALKMEVELTSETPIRNNKTTPYPNVERHSLKYLVGLYLYHAFVCYDSKLQATTE
jgi:hypothetical protein